MVITVVPWKRRFAWWPRRTTEGFLVFLDYYETLTVARRGEPVNLSRPYGSTFDPVWSDRLRVQNGKPSQGWYYVW